MENLRMAMDASGIPDAYVRLNDSMRIQPPLVMTPRCWDSTRNFSGQNANASLAKRAKCGRP